MLICAGCLAPFAGKAFYIDDPLFLWAAEQIQRRPADPYGFEINWYVSPMRMADVTKNPPLACYALAAAAALLGWSEPALHLAFLLPAAGVAWGTYRLAEGLCGRPLLATLLAILTPVFLVSSTNVMCDTMMLCFWVWSLVCWRRGLERPGWFLAAGILISLCALTKYFGVSLIPLLLVCTLLARRRIIFGLAALLIPIAVLAAYQVLTERLYGRGLLLDAAGFSVGARDEYGAGWRTPLVGLAFTGGCLASILFYLPLLWPRRRWLAGMAALLTPLLALPLLADRGWDGALLIQAALGQLGGIAVVSLAIADLRRRGDADAWLLFLWAAGTLTFAIGINWVINGRTLLPLAPVAGILAARRLDLLRGPLSKRSAWMEAWPLIPAAVLALIVTATDYRQAEADRTAASILADRHADRAETLWFEGHWGFQYYLRRRGGVIVNFDDFRFRKGDLLVLPADNYGVLFEPAPEEAEEIEIIEQSASPLGRTMSEARGAGFYTHVTGPLPFVLGPAPPMRYRVLRFQTPVDSRSTETNGR